MAASSNPSPNPEYDTRPVCWIAGIVPGPSCNSPKQIKEEYNYSIDTTNIGEFEKVLGQNISQPIITISSDTTLPVQTIPIYKSHGAQTIYISNNPTHLDSSVIYLGIDKKVAPDEVLTELTNTLTTCYPIQKIHQEGVGIERILKTIKKNLPNEKPLHIILDLALIDKVLCPSVSRVETQTEFLKWDELIQIINVFSPHTKYLDILGFDETIDDPLHKYSKQTGEIIRMFAQKLFNLKLNSINIFTEDTRFLIYRPVMKLTEDDVGWYIVKFMSLSDREAIIAHLVDKVITISIDPDDIGEEMNVYITTTTMSEQNERSFYNATNITDYCLFPQEKISMCFELLNTSSE